MTWALVVLALSALIESVTVRLPNDPPQSEIALYHPEVTDSTMLPTDEDGKLTAYAWPGGYPVLYLDRDNSTLCPACAQKELEDAAATDCTVPVAWFVHYERNPEICSQCNA